jgi:hypothetical protein
MPAQAVITTFAAYEGINTSPGVRFQNNGSTATNGTGGSIYTITTPTGTTPGTRQVRFSFLQGALSPFVTNVVANFTLLGTTASPAQTAFSFKIEPSISGGFSFLSTSVITVGTTVHAIGANLLSGTFNDAAIAGQNAATSAGFGGSTGGGATITFTSDFLTFSPVGDKDFSISLTSLTPVIFANPGFALRSFRAYSTGSFSSDPAPLVNGVPEPSVWGLMIIGFGMVGVQARRRSGNKAVTA